ncbi:cobalt transporter CbiM [Xanthobacter sp. KR7-225]|uniref:cobalt transporter CbiM n=1 Tax=Xanthobacter sp. KR7-225 TaxID=3156613 RepID=UPI0032B3F78A
MAHIPDGVLSVPVLAGGAVLAVAGIGYGLRRIGEEDIPKVAILACAFFAVSLVAIPVGPSSVHLLLSGLMGLMVGPAVFPAVFVGLVLQALMFGFGGLTTLGVNTVTIALPGLACGVLLGLLLRGAAPARAGVVGAVAGAACVLLTGGMVAGALALSASEFVPSARIILLTYLPLAVGEALVTGFAVAFLAKVRPEAFAAHGAAAPVASGVAGAFAGERP